MSKWIFKVYKTDTDYELGLPFFTKKFEDHGKLKNFSSKHSYENKSKYLDYVSTYDKINDN